jgi:hypothetical protein
MLSPPLYFVKFSFLRLQPTSYSGCSDGGVTSSGITGGCGWGVVSVSTAGGGDVSEITGEDDVVLGNTLVTSGFC